MSTEAGFEYSCDYCRIPFGRDVHIQCAKCHDIRLCLVCFAYGKELPPHKNNHQYYVIEYITKSIYPHSPKCSSSSSSTWTGHEEVLLLDGIEKYGFCYKKVAMHIGNHKTPKETELHYLQTYCKPDSSDNEDEDDDDDDDDDDDEEDSDDVVDDTQKTRLRNNPKLGAIQLNYYEGNSTQFIANTKSSTQCVQYYPHRHEFDAEFHDEAEWLISDLTSTTLYHPSTKQIAMNNLQQYDIILRLREYIKNFILDRKLLLLHEGKVRRGFPRNRKSLKDAKTHQEAWPIVKKQLLPKLQPFVKYFSSTQRFLDFLDTVVIVHTAWNFNIGAYLDHRKAGCRTIEDVNKRINHENQSHPLNVARSTHQHRYPSRFATRSSHNHNQGQGHKNKSRRNKRRRLNIIGGDSDSDNDHEYDPFSSHNIHSLDESDSDYLDTKKKSQPQGKNSVNNKVREPAMKKQKLAHTLNRKFVEKMEMKKEDELNISHILDEEMDYSKQTTPQPSYLLLSVPERDFIESMKMLPTQYMQYKNVILMENIKNGCVEPKQLKKYWPHFTQERIQNFCDFYARLGWIQIAKS